MQSERDGRNRQAQGPGHEIESIEVVRLGLKPASQPTSRQSRIEQIGNDIFERSGSATQKLDPTTVLMKWGMRDEHTKVRLLHFIDALAKLTNQEVRDHLPEYFPFDDKRLPAEMRYAALAGKVAGHLPLGAQVVGATTRAMIMWVASKFFAGPEPKDVLRAIDGLDRDGQYHTVDVLGEAVLSEKEAEDYVKTYERMLTDQKLKGKLNNVSVKLSSLYSRFDPMDYEGTKEAVKTRLKRIVEAAKENNVLVNVDMEQYAYKDITLDIFKEMLDEDKGLNRDNFGIAVQAYLKDSGKDIDGLIEFARENGRTFTVRLVKGAYWEYETATAEKTDWPVPVYEDKRETDRNFEEQARKLLESGSIKAAFGTHNVRSMSYVLAVAEEIKEKTGAKPDFEFQMLRGMGDNFKQTLVDMGHKVRVYTPCGELLPGMGYLVRRILENTSNDSFLRQADFERTEWEKLLRDPREAEPQAPAAQPEAHADSIFHIQQIARSNLMHLTADSVSERSGNLARIMREQAGKAEAISRMGPTSVITCPGEENTCVYMPRGRGVIVADGLSLSQFSEVLSAALVTGNTVTVAGKIDPEAMEFITLMRENMWGDRFDVAAADPGALAAAKDVDWVFASGPQSGEFNRIAAETSRESVNVKRFIQGINPDLIHELFTTKSICTNTMRRGFAPAAKVSGGLVGFSNQPPEDYSKAETRRLMMEALAKVEGEMGGEPHPLVIGGKERALPESRILVSTNPAHPDQIVGSTYNATRKDADDAVAAARKAAETWGRMPAAERASCLQKAGVIMRERRFELAAIMVKEGGKAWREAMGDVDEAIDFMEYYPQDAIRLEKEDRKNHPGWERTPNGVCAVISPWNFPLAILTGMAVGAAASGNTVILKPASQTPIIAGKIMDILQEADFPPGVFNFLPGSGREIGDHLVKHPDVDMLAFTGSEEVGMSMIRDAARVERGGRLPKTVIAEMGGKNAIIVDSSADLDQAVAAVIKSAFGYGGQKCSACSRVIVTKTVYREFTERLKAAAESLKVDDPANPKVNLMGPVIDDKAKNTINGYKRIAREESLTKLVEVETPTTGGHYVKPTIYMDVPRTSRLAQEEIFGPILVVMEAKDYDDALEIANGVRFGLTGGLISRTPSHIRDAEEEMQAGNLYINRGTTGAEVDRQPFGGDKHSGTGPKAGGPDYLRRFTHWERVNA